MSSKPTIESIAKKCNLIAWGLDPNDYISREQELWRAICIYAPFELYGRLRYDARAQA